MIVQQKQNEEKVKKPLAEKPVISLIDLYEHGFKDTLREAGFHDIFLHLVAGPIIMLVIARMTRRSFLSIFPFIGIAVGESVNEAIDYMHYGSLRWHDTLNDVLGTFFVPFLAILIFAIRQMWIGLPKIHGRSGQPPVD